MLKNFFKVAIRSLIKDKFFSFLNISGLAIGISCCILIMTFVNHEISYDKHLENQEDIYRVVISGSFNGNDFTSAQTPSPAGATFRDRIPQIKERLRFRSLGSWVVQYENKVFTEDQVVFADETLFDVFNLNLIQGNPKTALLRKNQVVISQSMAKKYFGNEDPLQKILKFDNDEDYVVTGVYADIPSNTHFSFDLILSFVSLENEYSATEWLNQAYYTYVTLKDNSNFDNVTSSINEIAVENMAVELNQFLNMSFDEFEEAGNSFEYFLQPLDEIHLYSEGYGGFEPEGDVSYVYIFSAIAAFILILACINFMNLSTARSANRAKEVGIRKVLGSVKTQLIGQFITESILLTFISGIIGVGIASVLLPFFNNLAGIEMIIDHLSILPFVLVGSIVVGFLAGVYPAFFLSAFAPVKVLKGNLSTGLKSGSLRKALVTFQFFISILLIIGTFSIINQMDFIQSKKLGFQKDRVLLVQNAYMLGNNLEAFRNRLEALPQVVQTSATSYLPTSSNRSSTVFFPDAIVDQDRGIMSQSWRVDEHYLNVFGLEIVKGRFFSEEYSTDSSAMVINETAAKMFGITDLEGATIGDYNDDGSALIPFNIIGIVKDFHFESLKNEIGPIIMRLRDVEGYLAVKLNSNNYQQVIDDTASAWNQLAPDQPFEYAFLDDRFSNMYETESQLGDIFSTFAVLAILIACLGLFGLAAFTAQQKSKEVGVRKVLGASLGQLIYLMSKEVTFLVLLAFVLASVVGWYGVNLYFQGFAYRPQVNLFVFLLAGGSAFLIALLTMSYQSIKVATANPIKALRSE